MKHTGQESQRLSGRRLICWAALLAINTSAAGTLAQASAAPPAPNLSGTTGQSSIAPTGYRSSSAALLRRAPEMPPRARQHYQLLWGVDSLDVRAVESGQMIRFSYSVLDPQKAAPLNDKVVNPFLIDEQARVKLEIPTMEKVGQLRQSSTPEAGKTYWMVFSNKGAVVKPGDRVTVVIGHFRADGLYVH